MSKGLQPCYTLPDDFEENPRWSKAAWNRGAHGFRLPTEAEWEYAARAHQSQLFAGSNHLDDVGWYYKNSQGKTHPVGMKRPNAFGLYDMNGNVWEWVYDSYLRGYRGYQLNPYHETNDILVRRGGSWYGSMRVSRSSFRGQSNVSRKYFYQGFRFVRYAPTISRL